MGYNGKLPGKDEVAGLIIDALRQDKKEAVIKADVQVEVDKSSFKAAEAQIDQLTKSKTIDVDTSKAEKKIKNLLNPLREVAREIQGLGSSGSDFSTVHNTIKKYEQLKISISEVSSVIDKNNQELIEARGIIRSVEAAIKGLDITVEKATKKARTSRKKQINDDITSHTDAIIAQGEAIQSSSEIVGSYEGIVSDTTSKLKEQIGVQNEHTTGVKRATKEQEKLNKAQEKQLKLIRKKTTSGQTIPQTYTTSNGLYEVEKGNIGWNLYKKDKDGFYKLITTYETLGDLRRDSALIAEQEAESQVRSSKQIVSAQEKVVQELTILSGAYDEMSHRAGRSAKFAEQYSAAFIDVQNGALSAADAIKKLNEFIANTSVGKKLTSSYDGLADAVQKYVAASKQLWEAYDSGKDFSKFVSERNAAIKEIVKHFPKSAIGVDTNLLQGGYGMYLESFEWSRTFARDGAEATLKTIEDALNRVQLQMSATKQSSLELTTELEKTADVEEKNQRLILSYKDLYKEIEKIVSLSKQLKPEYLDEYLEMMRLTDNTDSFINNKEAVIAEIKAWYENVQKIKSSIKNGLSVYKYVGGDGYSYEDDANEDTLAKAEATLRGYIISAVSNFGYTLSEAMDDFPKKRMRYLVEDQINKYYEIDEKQERYDKEVEAFNTPIREQIDKLSSGISSMATSLENIKDVAEVLSDFSNNAKNVNRYTLSSGANKIGKLIDIQTPYEEIRMNAKRIESYEELNEVIARYKELQSGNVIFGGKDWPGLDENAELEFRNLTERLKLTAGDDVFRRYSFYSQKDVENLAKEIGLTPTKSYELQNGQLAFIEGAKESIIVENDLQEEIKETNYLLEGQISFEEQLANATKLANEQLKQQGDLSKIVSRDVINRALQGVNPESLLGGYGLQGDDLTHAVDLFKDLVGAIYLGDKSPKGVDAIFGELYDFVSENAQHTEEVVKTLQEFREHMKGTQIRIPENMESSFVEEFVDEWKNIKKLYAIGGNSKNKKKLITTSKYASTPDSLMLGLLQDGFEYVFNRSMMESFNGSPQDSLRILLDAIQRAKDEFKLPNTKTIFGLDEGAQTDFVVQLSNAIEVISKNVESMRPKIEDASINGEKFADSSIRAAGATEQQIAAEKELAEIANATADAKERQLSAAQEAVSVEEIIAKNVSDALEKLRSAKNNETTLFNLKGVFDGEDLIQQAQNMVQNIAEQANLSLSSFSVKDDIIKAKLYNEELQVTVDQVYKLRAAAEDAESAMLELTSQSFTQNVKALNENNFDTDGIRQRAQASIEKVRSSLHGLEYDLTDLEAAAKSIASKDDFDRFNNQLKATNDNIQAIKNSTVSKNSMNPLANMQRDMQNANIEIETMRLKLEKFGDIQGVSQAKVMLEEMVSAAKQYREATDAQGQQSAYNQYSNLRSSYKAQYEYINAAKTLNESQENISKQTDPIKEQYKTILDTVTKINSLNGDILKYQEKDGGSGIFSGYIQQLQSEKEQLISQLQSVAQEINTSLSGGFVQGTEYSLPFANILSDDDWMSISSFFNDTRTQASLTTDEIERFIASLQKSQKIDVEAAAKVTEQFKAVQDTYKQITSISNIDKNNINYQAVGGMFADIMRYKDMLSSDPTQWSAEENANLQNLINNFTKYGNILAQVGQKEEKYFADKSRYTKDTTMSTVAEDAKMASEEIGTAQQKLTEAAKTFAKESGGDAIITKFATSADGISKLDFSVFDSATNSIRNFRMEMGSVTNGMYLTETTVSKSLANIQAAQKQVNSIQDLVERIGTVGAGVGMDSAIEPVQRLLNIQRQLSEEASKGSASDQGIISDLIRRSKLASAEVEKLYKQLLQMESAIDSGTMTGLGIGDPNGDVYGQLINQANEFAKTQQGAALEVGRFDETTNTLNASLLHTDGTIEHLKFTMSGLNGQMASQNVGVGKLQTSWEMFSSTIKKAVSRYTAMFTGFYMFYRIIAVIRSGVETVKKLDKAMTELKKVTDESEESYAKFINTMTKYGREVGANVTDLVTSAADWARLGYSIKEAGELAKNTSILMNVSEFDNVSNATDSLISALQAYKKEGKDVESLSMRIVDAYNNVGNKFAISTSDLANSLTRSSAALVAANNDLAQSIALTTAANTTIQDPESVGNALKVVSMRIRGAKTEIEEAGEETDGMIESTSKLQQKIMALTNVDGKGGIDILTESGDFKSTYEILLEISKVWEKISDISRASLLETLAGKTRGSVIAGLMQNGDILEDAYEAALNSSGSAQKELDTFLDSIEGKSQQLSNNMQIMWENTLNSGVIKWFYDLLIAVTDLTKGMGLLPPALGAILAYFALFKKITIGSLIGDGVAGIKSYALAIQQVSQISSLGLSKTQTGMLGIESVNAYAQALSGLSAKQQAVILSSAGLEKAHIAQVLAQNGADEATIRQIVGLNALNTAQQAATAIKGEDILATLTKQGVTLSDATATWLADNATKELTKDEILKAAAILLANGATEQEIVKLLELAGASQTASVGIKGLGAALKTMLLSNPLGMILMIVSALSLIKNLINKNKKDALKETKEEFEEIQNIINETKSEIQSLESELSTLQEEIDALDGKTLSFVEDQELERLKKQRSELEQSLKIQEQLLELQNESKNATTVSAIKAYTKATSQGAEETKKSAEATGKWAGAIGAAALALGVLLAIPSGGTSLAAAIGVTGSATIVGGAGAIGYFAGEAIGEAAGSKLSANNGSYEAWYKTYEKALETARKSEQEALAEYQKDSSNIDKLNKWQEAQSKVSDIETEMYNHLSQLQQYHNELEYGISDEINAELNDWYYFMDKFSIKNGAKDAKQTAINRLFGEGASEAVKEARKELEKMAKEVVDGDRAKIDLKEAFGDENEYDSFVATLRDLGIYVFEVEDAFKQMYEAEKAAAEVDFVDIVKDIQGVAAAITGMKNAFEEFLETGAASVETILDLEQYFNTEDLKEAYNNYVGVMMTGTSSIEEAQEATAKLAQKYLDSMINTGSIDVNQKQVYVNLLKRIGIKNAEEFIDHEMQQAALKEFKTAYEDFVSKKDELTAEKNKKNKKNIFDTISLPFSNKLVVEGQMESSKYIDGDSVTLIDEELQNLNRDLAASKEAIAEKYGFELSIFDQMIAKVDELTAAEKTRDEALNTYNKTKEKITEYKTAKGAYEYAKSEYDAAYATASDVVRNFDQKKWGMHYATNEYDTDYHYYVEDGIQHTYYENQYNEIQTAADNLKKLAAQKDTLKESYEELLKTFSELGYVDDDGNVFEGIENSLLQAYKEAKAAVENFEKEIDEDLNYNIDLTFIEKTQENTLSDIKNSIKEYNSLLNTLNETSFDGARISEEYYNTLREQLQYVTVGTEDFFDAIDTSNGYVIKNAQLLKQLAQRANKVGVANAKNAKSQAMLQYYKLSKEMSKYIDISGKEISVQKDKVLALGDEMKELEKLIASYSRLEMELLDVADAYNKFETAQNSDSESDYIGSIENMVVALGEAFNTAELGTESAQAAIANLVPESVYKDLDTVDEKMAAIYDYFKNGKLSQYIDIGFDDDGNVESAEMKLGNLRKFIEDGLNGDNNNDGVNVFKGTDWRHFEFSEEFLNGLNDSRDKLQYFADQMNVTKEVAFAFIESLNDHDIEWLGGDYSSMFDVFTDTLVGNIYKTTQDIADLNTQLASGKINAQEYYNEMYGLGGQLQSGEITLEQFHEQASALHKQLEDGVITYYEYNKAMAGLSGADIFVSDEAEKNSIKWFDTVALLEEKQQILENLKNGLNDNGDREISRDEAQARMKLVMKEIDELSSKLLDLEEPTEIEINLAIESLQRKMDEIESQLGYNPLENGAAVYNTITSKYEVTLDTNDEKYLTVKRWVDYLNEQHMLNVELGAETPTVVDTLQDLNTTIISIRDILLTKFDLTIDTDGAIKAIEKVEEKVNNLPIETILPGLRPNYPWYNGDAYATGSSGLKTKEHNALVGELGPEMVVDPSSGKYYTVGDNGAEMVNLPKGAIIFNHKQTNDLLKNGRIASRGRAYAEGNAHVGNVTIWPNGSSQTQWNGTGYSSWDDSSYDLAEALDDAAGSVNDFEETIDWIEYRMQELDNALAGYSANLENASTYGEKNNLIDEMFRVNQDIYSNAMAGAEYYRNHAETYLEGMSDELVKAAKNGAISITEFTKEQDEATINAIQNYRDFAQKATDLTQKATETITEIRNLAIQKIDNIQSYGSAKTNIEDAQTEKLQNKVDLDEAMGLITSPAYYEAMMENSGKKIEYWSPLLEDMQAEFNDAVKSGKIEVGSIEWYEQLAKLYEVQAEIDAATIELEEFQNAINDIYWDNFDQLINRIDYLKDETQSLIDLMNHEDMVTKPEGRTYEGGTVEYWTADDVQWTEEGLASLGLYAQQMEIAQYESEQYAEAINDLTEDYNNGLYSENEYYEKLNELTSAQYDCIESYYDAQDAIKDLNETRIDSIKEGIEKEIDAYSELIEKTKEQLSAEKDLYDFQRTTTEKQKDIAEIERKLAALANDSSLSAAAKRKQLEAELAEAQYDLQDTYYNRSVENKQESLDKEFETFKEEKEAEIKKWDDYLTNVEKLVEDSLRVVQANADNIGNTLTDKTEQYNITVSDAVLSPWKDGANAIGTYTTAFDKATSSTTQKLTEIKNAWQEVIAQMNEAGNTDVSNINSENANYAAAEQETTKPEATTTTTTQTQQNTSAAPSLTQGSYVEVKPGTKWYSDSSGGGSSGLAKSGTIKYINTNGSHAYNIDGLGWIKKEDIVGYAKGTKGVKENQLALIDELGDEIVMHAQNGRLAYLTKGSAVIPHDISDNLMKLGKLDPSNIIEQNRPSIGIHPEMHNTEINISVTYGDMISIEEYNGGDVKDLEKMVAKQFDKHTKDLNNAIRKYVR